MQLRTRTLALGLCLPFFLGPVFAAPAAGEETARVETKKKRTVMKSLRYVDAKGLLPILALMHITADVDSRTNTLILRGTNSDLDTALKVVDNLDRPTADIELRTHILGGSKSTAASVDVPPSVVPAAEQLRELFGYSEVHLVDTLFVRVTDQRDVQLTGGSSADGQSGLEYALAIGNTRLIRGEEGLSVMLEDLHFDSRPVGGPGFEATLRTDVEVREGQTVIVGKASHKGSDEAIILVIEVDIEE